MHLLQRTAGALSRLTRSSDRICTFARRKSSQETLESVRILVVPAEGWGDRDKEAIIAGVRRTAGNVAVQIDVVPHIERTWMGKFRIIVSKVSNPEQLSIGGARGT